MSVPEHKKQGKIIPFHSHFDIRYLLQANETENLIMAEKEVSDVKWFNVNEIQNLNIDIMPIIKRVMQKILNIYLKPCM